MDPMPVKENCDSQEIQMHPPLMAATTLEDGEEDMSSCAGGSPAGSSASRPRGPGRGSLLARFKQRRGNR